MGGILSGLQIGLQLQPPVPAASSTFAHALRKVLLADRIAALTAMVLSDLLIIAALRDLSTYYRGASCLT